jgi:hypothetical protein
MIESTPETYYRGKVCTLQITIVPYVLMVLKKLLSTCSGTAQLFYGFGSKKFGIEKPPIFFAMKREFYSIIIGLRSRGNNSSMHGGM